ncbi:brevican core protein [Bufo gargarizans]|uniref:brevican core protein n=1 Tax=Bufo gargarizans TaxID=30331 RepID=UPI001CF20442|nr:brevican core protein [Bufo gargarizans]XP_044127921.1 brevican core protein [Bufo gargarizans]
MKLYLLLLFLWGLTAQALTSDTDGGSKNYKSLKVKIENSTTKAVLSGTLTIPCHITYHSEPEDVGIGRRAVLTTPRVKWTFISNGKEEEILVARGHKVKISEGYKSRASLPEYSASAYDVTLVLRELIRNDSGIYRCHVQHGIEDDYAMVEVKIKGVVFLYREGTNRYTYTFTMAQEACARIKAHIATADQLLAAYHGGFEQCDAGWIADQTVRYPIHTPREGCYGDMDGFPGVRNYGVLDPDDMYDVYCYAEDLKGQVFLSSSPNKFTLVEAKEHCKTLGTEIATTGQLYSAWSEGLDQCNPGWLADGSVRYPIVTPRERCGGNAPGVKTIFLFRNQTGFPNSQEKYDVYCFRGKDTLLTHDPPVPRDRDVITVTESFEELKFPDVKAENEAQGLVHSIPLDETHLTKTSQEDKNTTVLKDEQESPPSPPHPTSQTHESIVSDEEDLSPAFASFPPYEDHSDDNEESTIGYTINMPILQSSQETKVGLVPEDTSSESTRRTVEGPVLPTAGDSILSVIIVSTHAENFYDNFTGSAQEPGVAVSESANYYHTDENPDPTQFPKRENETDANIEKETDQGDEYNITKADDSSVMSTIFPSTLKVEVSHTDTEKKLAELYDNQAIDTTSQTTAIYMFPTVHPSTDHFEGSGQEDQSAFSGGLIHSQTTQGSVVELASGYYFSATQDPIKDVHDLDSNLDPKTPIPPSSQPKLDNSSKLSWEDGSGDVTESTWITLNSGSSVNTNITQKHKTNVTVEKDGQHNTTHTPMLLTQGLYGSKETSSAPVSHLLSPNMSRVQSIITDIREQTTIIGTVENTKDLESKTDVSPTFTTFTSSPNNPRNSSHHNLEKTIPPTASLSPSDPLPAVPTEKAIVGSSINFSDICYPNPCENGGTCIDEDDGEFRCLCLPGYFGKVCHINVDKCLEDWDTFQGFCYKHFYDRKRWEEAETHCREYGGHLVSIVTPEEQDFVNNQYKDFQWTGLNDRTIEGDFQWSDGNPLLFENWNQGQPDSYFLSGEDCVVMGWHDGGLWSDVPCNYHLPYTCKMGLVSCGPPPEVVNASIYGRPKKKYPISSVVGYRCDDGFVKRNLPIIKCQSDGVWEEPQINCLPALQ